MVGNVRRVGVKVKTMSIIDVDCIVAIIMGGGERILALTLTTVYRYALITIDYGGMGKNVGITLNI